MRGLAFGIVILCASAAAADDVVIANHNGQLVRLSTAGGKPEKLKIKVEDAGGTMGVGSSSPILSPDGKLVAYVQKGDVWIVSLEGKKPKARRLSKLPRSKKFAATEVNLTSFSPDGQWLLAHFGAASEEEGPSGENPKIKYGFHVFDVASGADRHWPDLPSFLFWSGDGSAAIFDDGGKVYQLFIGEGARTELRFLSGAGLQQVDQFDTEVTYSGDRIRRVRLDGSKLPDVTPTGGFTTYQWPRYSPDGKHIAYVYSDGGIPMPTTSIRVVELATAKERTLVTCEAQRCQGTWISNDWMAYRSDDALMVVPTAGGEPRRIGSGYPLSRRHD